MLKNMEPDTLSEVTEKRIFRAAYDIAASMESTLDRAIDLARHLTVEALRCSSPKPMGAGERVASELTRSVSVDTSSPIHVPPVGE
jgi:hypothetical protein